MGICKDRQRPVICSIDMLQPFALPGTFNYECCQGEHMKGIIGLNSLNFCILGISWTRIYSRTTDILSVFIPAPDWEEMSSEMPCQGLFGFNTKSTFYKSGSYEIIGRAYVFCIENYCKYLLSARKKPR